MFPKLERWTLKCVLTFLLSPVIPMYKIIFNKRMCYWFRHLVECKLPGLCNIFRGRLMLSQLCYFSSFKQYFEKNYYKICQMPKNSSPLIYYIVAADFFFLRRPVIYVNCIWMLLVELPSSWLIILYHIFGFIIYEKSNLGYRLFMYPSTIIKWYARETVFSYYLIITFYSL